MSAVAGSPAAPPSHRATAPPTTVTASIGADAWSSAPSRHADGHHRRRRRPRRSRAGPATRRAPHRPPTTTRTVTPAPAGTRSAAFVALIALVAGGVLLVPGAQQGRFRDASASHSTTTPTSRSTTVTAALRALELTYEVGRRGQPRRRRGLRPPHRPAARARSSAREPVIKLYYNPTPDLVPVPERRRPTAAGGPRHSRRRRASRSTSRARRTTRQRPRDPHRSGRRYERSRRTPVITIFVSGGPQQIAIPAIVIGDSVDAATAARWRIEPVRVRRRHRRRRTPRSPAGTVIAHPARRPARWSTAAARSPLIVSAGPGQVTRAAARRSAPRPQARNSSTTKGLDASTSTYSDLQPGDANDGPVLSQNMAPGQRGRSVARSSPSSSGAPPRRAPRRRTTTTTTTLPPDNDGATARRPLPP